MAGDARTMSLRAAIVVSAMAGLTTFLHAETLRAEEPGISATGKGITGGALLGGELVVAVEAIAGVKPTWAYVVGGLAGAAAGGVGGYFVEQGSDPKPSFYMLAAGMALIIPTTVAVLQATSYKAPVEYTEEKTIRDSAPAAPASPEAPATGAPPAPAAPGATPALPAPATQPTSQDRSRPPRVALSLVDLEAGTLRLSVPVVQVHPVYTSAELQKYGVEQRAEVRVPVFQAIF
jgi:hypothetical protein